MNQILESWPAMVSLVALFLGFIIIFISRREIRQKIGSLSSIGGEKGARWPEPTKGKLPKNNLETIHTDGLKKIEDLEDEKEAILEFAQEAIEELEEVKIELFFERVLNALHNWQYLLLKLLYEAPNQRLTVKDLENSMEKVYAGFEERVSAKAMQNTFEQLRGLQFIEAVKPYTEETPITLTHTGKQFVEYVNEER